MLLATIWTFIMTIAIHRNLVGSKAMGPFFMFGDELHCLHWTLSALYFLWMIAVVFVPSATRL